MHVTPDMAKKLEDLAAISGRAPEEIIEDALTGYREEVASVTPIDGEDALRRRCENRERRSL